MNDTSTAASGSGSGDAAALAAEASFYVHEASYVLCYALVLLLRPLSRRGPLSQNHLGIKPLKERLAERIYVQRTPTYADSLFRGEWPSE